MPSDPKAGQLAHEIGGRMVWHVLCAIPLLALFYWAYELPDWMEYLYWPATGCWLGVPEGMVRKSWRLGLLSVVLVMAVMLLAGWLSDLADVPFGAMITMPVASFSMAGLLAGLGTRSLLASFFGMLSGPMAFYAIAYVIDFADERFDLFPAREEQAVALGAFIFSVLLPIFLGLAVWAGVKLSRCGRSNPPGASVPGSV